MVWVFVMVYLRRGVTCGLVEYLGSGQGVFFFSLFEGLGLGSLGRF